MKKNEMKVSSSSMASKLKYAFSICILTSMSGQALANPNGAQVVNGSVQINAIANQLNIHNSNGAIINWQNFSIGQQEISRFIQQNSTSAVLNRVVGQNPSAIMGQLLSNGHVFLLNPNGVVFGANAVVDTAGLVASSLNMSDESFLSGKYKFSGDGSNGAVINRGLITAGKGGEIVLIAPTVENHGVISVEGGRILLAAGEKMTLSSLDLEGIEFEVQAPTNTAMNLGKLLASGGSVGVFAGSLTNTGVISANSVTKGKDGKLWLEASSTATVSGKLSAPDITIAGSDITLKGADISASNEVGGGQIRIGGDYQGAALGPNVSNAKSVTVDAATTISANAQTQGDGGRVIVWSDENTVVNGHISATGGSQSGNGGFVETSGKKALDFTTPVDVSAVNGKAGTWLIDPEDITIDESKASSIETALNAGSNVDIKTSDSGEGEGNITVAAAITKSEGDDATLSLDAHNKIDVNAPITSTSNKLDVKLTAGNQVNVNSSITTNGGSVATLITGTSTTAETPIEVPADPATDTTSEPASEPVAEPVPGETAAPETTEVASTDTTPAETVVTVEETVAELNTSIAGSIETSGGDISINAGDTGSVLVEGTLDASNYEAGATGGNIEVLADQVELAGDALLDASGDAGGGTIKVGGDYQGQGETPTATDTTVGESVLIKADAVTNGDGGTVIVWSDDTTVFHGNISAQGGQQGGDGGFAEVSGKQGLLITGHANLNAEQGKAGTLLLDPGTVDIDPDDPSSITPPDAGQGLTTFYIPWVEDQLNNFGSLVIRTADVADPVSGTPVRDINLNFSLNWNSANDFTLEAGNDINLDGDITNSGTGSLFLSSGLVDPTGATYINADVSMDGGGSIDATGGSGSVVFNSGNTVSLTDLTATSISTDSGTSTLGFTTVDTLSLSGGNIRLRGGGTYNGAVTVGTGATLSIYEGTHTFKSGSSITGAGDVEFLLGGATTFENGSSYSNAGLTYVQSTATTVNFNTGSTVVLNDFTLNLGTVQGSDAMTIAGLFDWQGGFLAGDGTTTANGGINILGGLSKNLGATATDTRTLVNAAGQTLAHSGTGVTITGNTTLVNKGDFNISGGGILLNSVTGILDNQGTLNINLTSNTDQLWIRAVVNNSGTINLNTGTLLMSNGGTYTGTSSLTAAAGTTVNFSGNNDVFSFENNSSFSAYDVNMASSNSINFNTGNAVNILGNLSLGTGTIGGNDDVNIAGLFSWSSGFLGGDGTTTANGGINLTGASTKFIGRSTADARVLINATGQTANWTDGNLNIFGNSSVFRNLGTLNVDVTNSKTISGGGRFENQNITNVNLASNTDFFAFDSELTNTGSINVNTGDVRFGRNSTHSGTASVTGAAGTTIQFGLNTASTTHNFSAGTSLSAGNLVIRQADTVVNLNSTGTAAVDTLLIRDTATLAGDADMTISGLFTWQGGTLGGDGTTYANGGISLAGSFKYLGSTATDNRTLINASGQDADWSSGFIYLNGATASGFINKGNFNISGGNNRIFRSGLGGTFDNQGTTTIDLSTDTSSLSIWTKLNNTGDIHVKKGILELANAGTHSNTAKLRGDAGTTLKFSSASYAPQIFDPDTIFIADKLEVTSGTLNLNTTNTTTLGAVTLGIGTGVLRGTLALNTGNTVTLDSLNIIGGSLAGNDDVNITGSFDWSLGRLEGKGITTANGGINLTGSGIKQIGRLSTDTRKLVNASGQTASWDDGDFYIFRGQFVNDGTFNITGSTRKMYGFGSFSNTGVTNIALDTNIDVLTLDITTLNSGQINLQKGIYEFTRTFTNTGSLSADAGTTLDVGGNLTIDPSSSFSVDKLRLSGGSFYVNKDIAVNEFIQTGGFLRGTNSLTVNNSWAPSSGVFNFGHLILGAGVNESLASTTLNGTGLLTNLGTLTLDNSIINTSFDNRGTLNVSNTTFSGASTTLTSGTFNVSSGAVNVSSGVFDWEGGSITGAGTLDLSSASSADLIGSNARVLDGTTLIFDDFLLAGGSLELRSGTLNDVALSTIASGATLILSGGLFDSAGGMDVNGTLTMTGGDLNVNTSPLNINVGGLLNGDTGGGTITGDVFNFGTIAPGNSPGTINIVGNLTLDANSLLDFEVGPDSSTYDILNVSGLVDFGGASLAINWFGGYTPAAGDSYQMINYGGFTGSLGSITAPIEVTSDYLQNNLLISGLVALTPGNPVEPGNPPFIPVAPAPPVYPETGNVIQLVVAMWEDAVSQWVHDPSDLSSAYILTGAINGDNGDRESGGKGQKVYLAEWNPEADGEYITPLMCN